MPNWLSLQYTHVHAIGMSAQAKTYAPISNSQQISQKRSRLSAFQKTVPTQCKVTAVRSQTFVFRPTVAGLQLEHRSQHLHMGRTPGTCKAKLYGGHRDWVRCLKYRPDGDRMASGGDDGAADLNMTNGNRLQRLAGHQGFVRQLAYSADGHLLATAGTDGIICIWQADIMQCLQRIGPVASDISDVAFDPKGQGLRLLAQTELNLQYDHPQGAISTLRHR